MEQLLVLIERVAHPAQAVAARAPSGHARPPGTGTEAGPVLDPSHLDRLRQLDDHDDFLGGLIRDFIADAEQLVEELEAAALQCDAAAFRDRAHALRSSAAHLGATALFELCLGWRGISRDDLAAQGSAHAMRLRSEFERLREALLLELTQPPARAATVVSRPH
jgi:two-component system, sensor histidine kinase RpfC